MFLLGGWLHSCWTLQILFEGHFCADGINFGVILEGGFLSFPWNQACLSQGVCSASCSYLQPAPFLLGLVLMVNPAELSYWWHSDLKGLFQPQPFFFQPSLIIFLRNLTISPRWVLESLLKSLFDYCIINNFWARFWYGGKGCGCQVGSSTAQGSPGQSGHLRVTAAAGLWEKHK